MLWVCLGISFIAALAIIVIGICYFATPRAAAPSFGLPMPENGPGTTWWLRLKGVRDIVSGLVILALMIWAALRIVGIALGVEALIPIGDMSLILAAKGSTKAAFGIHGVTALLMLLAAIPLIIGVG